MHAQALIDRLIEECDALRAQLASLRAEATPATVAPIRQKVQTFERDLEELEHEVAANGNGSKPREGNGRENAKSAYDLAMELGVIGAYKDAPPDLSTNKKYLEGFGRE